MQLESTCLSLMEGERSLGCPHSVLTFYRTAVSPQGGWVVMAREARLVLRQPWGLPLHGTGPEGGDLDIGQNLGTRVRIRKAQLEPGIVACSCNSRP